jgi:hypothetical protein
MQEQDKSQAPLPLAPSESPGCEQIAIPQVGGLLEEMESALASSRRDDALRQEKEQRLRYLVSTDVYRERYRAEEERYRYMQEMRYREDYNDRRYRERYRAEEERYQRMYGYPDLAVRRSRCNIDCKCDPCRNGECQDCTEEGGNSKDRYGRRDAAMGGSGAEPWPKF